MVLGTSAIGSLTCLVLNSSLIVIVSSFNVSKSTVKAYGIPHSSVLAYLLPTVWVESSTLLEIPALVNIFSKTIKAIFLTNFLNPLVEFRCACKWQEGAFKRWDVSWEVEIGSLGVLLSYFKAVFEDAVDNSSDTVRGFNYVRDVLLLHHSFCLLCKADMLFSKGKLLAINRNRECFFFG